MFLWTCRVQQIKWKRSEKLGEVKNMYKKFMKVLKNILNYKELCDIMWQNVTKCDKMWQKCDKIWHNCDKVLKRFVKSRCWKKDLRFRSREGAKPIKGLFFYSQKQKDLVDFFSRPHNSCATRTVASIVKTK